jgi:hypothetical protein
LTVTHREDEPRVLLRSTDGRSLEGYAVTSAQWEPMPYPATPRLNDPKLWRPVAVDDVPEVQVWLHLLWDLKERKVFEVHAPELVDLELTEVVVRRAIVHYIIEILKLLPDGLAVSFQPHGLPALGVSAGPLPGRPWTLQVSYWVSGYPSGASDAVFDAFKGLFDAWGWSYRYQDDGSSRDLDAWTDENRKFAFHVNITRYDHGGVAMTWDSPYYPAENADTETTGMRMPSVITKDGIQSWEPPVYHDAPGGDGARSDDDVFGEIVHYYDFWRQVLGVTRNETHDPADWENGRLYFRSDYLEKSGEWPQWKERGDWGAWIIDPAPDGRYNVLRSVLPERSNIRQETVEVVFSRLVDAGKYVIAHLGDSARVGLGLKTLPVQWDDSGKVPTIEVATADSTAVDYLVRIDPTTDRQAAARRLKVYRPLEGSDAYAIAFPGDPYIRVLAMSFEQLNRSLLDGFPDDVTA